ncbi:hypothetical protein D3C76_1177440 [compost metagenome]
MGEDHPLLVVHVRLLLLDELLQLGGKLLQWNDRIHQDHLHHLLEFGTGHQQAGVLLMQAVGDLSLHHPVFQVVVIDHVFLGVMVLVGDLPQVVHHVPQQEIAHLLFMADGGQLVLEQRQQPGDVEMVLMQTG